jgi:CheY-like chemotaxis protein
MLPTTDSNPPARPRIVMLDDLQDLREAYAEVLRFGGFEVDEFSDARAALESIARAAPALVITDLTLQAGLDGYAAARAIRALPAGAQVKLVLLTGHTRSSVKDPDGLFDAILVKPVDPDALVELARALCG